MPYIVCAASVVEAMGVRCGRSCGMSNFQASLSRRRPDGRPCTLRNVVQVHPRLQTERLKLRPFLADDASRFVEFAGARSVADSMISIPHPLSPSMARSMIAANAVGFQAGHSMHFAIEPRAVPGMIGCVELRDIDRDHSQAELSFWIAESLRGQGFATEAAHQVVRCAFSELGLNRVYAHHMVRNPASGVVLRRLNMKQEGLLRERVCKWGVFEDVAQYAILRSDAAVS